MSQRITRINALLQREISEQMRRHYRSDTAAITISDVSVSADLRNAKIYYSVLGDDAEIAASQQLFRRIGKDIRQRVSREITLKYFPTFYYTYDPSLERGAEINEILDQLDQESK